MKISDKTTIGMPLKNMVSIMDLLKKSEQLPTDQEQFMLIEGLYKATEKLEITQEQNMTNKVNIQFLNKQLEKAILDIEKLKDKVRANGNGSHD